MYIYIYIYRERERDIDVYIYIYILLRRRADSQLAGLRARKPWPEIRVAQASTLLYSTAYTVQHT